MIDPLVSISPLDGRYHGELENLHQYFSEFALQRARLKVEVEWFIFLCNEAKLHGSRVLKKPEVQKLRELYETFDLVAGKRVKEIEKKTNHDVKAIEYYMKENLRDSSVADLTEIVHFGCTSEDINNFSYALILREFGEKEYFPVISGVLQNLYREAKKFKSVPMLSRTHGQPASPTTMGKELMNFVVRLDRQLMQLKKQFIWAKMNGAVGNFNAHAVAFPDVNWPKLSEQFIEQLGFKANLYTTQIEPHDFLAEIFDNVRRINTILIDLDRDIWTYISLGYFRQRVIAGQVGSSTMPHKVNPIDFENSEGNLGLANALFSHFSEKLPISRLQRDLTDSTVMRNIGVAFGYAILGYKSLNKGLSRLSINEETLKRDLDNAWEVLAEPIQTVLRKYGVEGAYEKLKELTRGKKVTQKEIHHFLDKSGLSEAEIKRLKKLTPAMYTGFATKLVDAYTTLESIK